MNINLIAPINNLGYGYVGLHVCDELMKLGHKVSLFSINPHNMECHPRHHDMIKDAVGNTNTFDVNAPCIRIWHQNDMAQFVGRGKHIGFPIFELNTFTDIEKHHLRSCDQLFVCSRWASKVCIDNQVTNFYQKNSNYHHTQVVPLGVDASVFSVQPSRRKPTIFLNVGKWEYRKGHDILISAFEEAFSPNDNVELWMMCDNPFPQAKEQVEKFLARYNRAPLAHKVRILPRVETDTQVAEVMQQADCGVFPSRAEGWNLEALEMLSCGKQVIATDYSAHTEFLTSENAWLMPISGLEGAYDGVWFHNQGDWANIGGKAFDTLVNLMRYIHIKKQDGELGLNEAGIETARKYSWEHTASTIIECLS